MKGNTKLFIIGCGTWRLIVRRYIERNEEIANRLEQ